MRATRRGLILGGAIAGAAMTVPLARHLAAERPALVLFDRRHAASRRFAAAHARTTEVAAEHAALWTTLRRWQGGAVHGLTRWNDFVLARAILSDAGMRPLYHRREGHLIRWAIA